MTRPQTARAKTADTGFEDALYVRAYEASSWASRNRNTAIGGAIAILVIALGLLWYAHYRSSMADRATTELTRVRATVQSGNNQLAISDLQKYLDSFGGTKQADEARLMLAQEYLVAGQADKAVTTLEPLAGHENTPEGAQAATTLAEAYEAAKSTDKAEQIYAALADKAPFLYQKADALDNAARLHAQRGDNAGAAELLKKLVDITPETSPERDVFILRMSEALAAAGKTPKAADVE